MSNIGELAVLLEGAASQLRPEVAQLMQFAGDLGVTDAKRRASSYTHTSKVSARTGRSYFPLGHVGGYVGEGPNVRTGDYRRSIGPAEVIDYGDGRLLVTFGSNKVQGPRLEFGFTGADSRGRSYNQKPLPHLVPAWEGAVRRIDETVPQLMARLL